MSIRYILRCLGYRIPGDGKNSSKLFGENLGVLLSTQNLEADLSKKHVAIAFHVVREAIAAGVISPYWLKGQRNPADILTKQLPRTSFRSHCDFLFWRPDFHVRDKNNLSELESED